PELANWSSSLGVVSVTLLTVTRDQFGRVAVSPTVSSTAVGSLGGSVPGGFTCSGAGSPTLRKSSIHDMNNANPMMATGINKAPHTAIRVFRTRCRAAAAYAALRAVIRGTPSVRWAI